MAIKVTTKLVPPSDIKGSGTPVNGISLRIPPMFIKICKAIQVLIPIANNLAKLSLDFLTIWKPRWINIINKII